MIVKPTMSKLFRISCPDCGEVHEDIAWRAARNWIPVHRRVCKFYSRPNQKLENVVRRKNGQIQYYKEIVCPICLTSRPISIEQYYNSVRFNKEYPERIGMHRTCRMRVFKRGRVPKEWRNS